ncbi:hypothetical protein PHG11b_31 [Flavobacterium phage 11b]|uniref:hypothetical protein n=1 Tax=Flavobacterium phage 11b TaxID=294631 RepID=UPI000044413D|nr:hypothetical protein PHG11b_31 [Flavobacterium phage 11b]CAH56658.1 hypothetical protein PHG11b_31 [Flavobacterium phage 11b]
MIVINEIIELVTITVNEQDVVNVVISETITPLTINVADVGLQGPQGIQGGIISKISGENLNSHTPIALVNNLAYKMDSSNPLHQFAFVGFTEVSSTIGNLCSIKQIGEITLAGFGLIPNQQYLSGVNGTLITSNLSATNFTKVIAYAVTSDTLQIIKDYTSINK